MMVCRELMDIVKAESRHMIEAQPSESAIGNMARRGILLSPASFLIRDICDPKLINYTQVTCLLCSRSPVMWHLESLPRLKTAPRLSFALPWPQFPMTRPRFRSILPWSQVTTRVIIQKFRDNNFFSYLLS